MIIENNNKKYFVPDEIGNDKTKTVADIFAVAIPYNEYILNVEIAELENEILELEALPDEVLTPNEEKMRLPELQDRLIELKK